MSSDGSDSVSQAGKNEVSMSLAEEIASLKIQYDDFKSYGAECSRCKGKDTYSYNNVDRAFSIHYVDESVNFICGGCGFKWGASDKGLA
jgi:hypothetical protein